MFKRFTADNPEIDGLAVVERFFRPYVSSKVNCMHSGSLNTNKLEIRGITTQDFKLVFY